MIYKDDAPFPTLNNPESSEDSTQIPNTTVSPVLTKVSMRGVVLRPTWRVGGKRYSHLGCIENPYVFVKGRKIVKDFSIFDFEGGAQKHAAHGTANWI